MKRLVQSVLAASAVAGSLMLPAAPASAATACDPGTGTYSGRCYTTGAITTKSTVVQSVPLINDSKYTVTMNCGFTSTITRSLSTGLSVTATAKATILKVVDLSTSATVSMNLTQTSSQATTAGGSVKLPPGGRVVCERLYGSVTTQIKEVTHTGSKTTTRNYSVTVPSTMGARIR
jgi:hypothetical protein